MNHRGKRIAFTVTATGLVVVLVLVIAHWKTVRDHVQAWHFQLMRETVTIVPDPSFHFDLEGRGDWSVLKLERCLPALAAYSGRNVLLDSLEDPRRWGRRYVKDPRRIIYRSLDPRHSQRRGSHVGVALLEVFRANGLRVFEQRFPRQAYVVMRAGTP
jgi:hypothetical protein